MSENKLGLSLDDIIKKRNEAQRKRGSSSKKPTASKPRGGISKGGNRQRVRERLGGNQRAGPSRVRPFRGQQQQQGNRASGGRGGPGRSGARQAGQPRQMRQQLRDRLAFRSDGKLLVYVNNNDSEPQKTYSKKVFNASGATFASKVFKDAVGVRSEQEKRQLFGDDKWQHDKYSGPEQRRQQPQQSSSQQAQQQAPSVGPKHYSGCKLVIRNLHYNVTHDDIQELFGALSGLSDSGILYDNSGRSEGVAYVIYETKETAEEAIQQYNNVQLDGMEMEITLEQPGVTKLRSGISVQGMPAPYVASRAPRGRGASSGMHMDDLEEGEAVEVLRDPAASGPQLFYKPRPRMGSKVISGGRNDAMEE